jgi:predicted RNase H-like nuclease (RuvC/YqgF family)
MSKTLAQKVEEVKKKVVHLLEQNHKLLSKNEELEGELRVLKQTLDAETQKTAELLNKIKIIKLAQNIGSPDSERADVTELKRKINEYIKEIDHCITMLND